MAGNEFDLEIGDADGWLHQKDRKLIILYLALNIFLFQIHQILKKVVQKLQSANFVPTPSLAAVLREQQPTL